MASIDLYRAWPSIRRRSAPAAPAVDPARSTVLDGLLGQQKAQRADPNRVADLLSQLITSIEGKPLSAFVPMAEAIPLLVGLTPQNLADFDEFLGAFIGVVTELGRVVTPGSVTSPSDSISANRRRLAAGSIGVRRADNVRPGRAATARRFDELMSFFSEGKTLAAVLGDGNDGLPPGVSEIVNSMLVAIKNNLKSGDPEAAREAGSDAAALVVAVHEAFFTEATAEKSGRTRRTARDHTGGLGGPVLVQKAPSDTARARVTAVEMDGVEFVVDPDTGKTVRKRKRNARKV